MMSIMIREEKSSDYDEIRRIIIAAFKDHPHSYQNEHKIIDALRANNALSLSLVAEENGQVVGHIAFSLIKINEIESNWYGLGPLSVKPDMQSQGIGTALITAGLSQLQEKGAGGCVVLGEPGYYNRFGFKVDTSLQLMGVPPEYFMTLSFTENFLIGEVTYHPTFSIS